MGEDSLREDDPLHVCDLCDRDAVMERDGLYRCAEHPLPAEQAFDHTPGAFRPAFDDSAWAVPEHEDGPDLEEAAMETRKMPAGARCEECGAIVTEKTIEDGRIIPDAFLDARAVHPDRLLLNLPCGHEALAIVRGDTPSFPQ